jgi:hypothetical protein
LKPIVLSPSSWKAIRDELHKDYPRSVFALRSKMRTVLGFNVREHRDWIAQPKTPGDDLNFGYYEDQVHLDFYSENKRTMFLMKYSELIKR